MKYVLDSSIGFKTLVPEALTDKAELLLQDYKNAVHELLSPDVYPVEVIHALTRAERQGRITPAEGGKLAGPGLHLGESKLLDAVGDLPRRP